MPIGAVVAGVGAVAGAGATIYSANKGASIAKSTSNNQIAAQKDITDKQIAQADKARAEAQALAAANSEKVGGITDTAVTGGSSAINDASTAALERLDRARADFSPYTTAGVTSLNKMMNPTDEFTKSPDYQFRLDQALKAVNTNKATNGMLKSGSALKGVTTTAGNVAGAGYNDWWTKQSDIMNTGLRAQGVVTGQDTNAANLLTNKGSNLANLMLSGAQIKANANNQGLNTSTNALLQGSANINGALGDLGKTTVDSLGTAGDAAGNAAIATGNAVSGLFGALNPSLSSFISKYTKPSTASSYSKNNSAGTAFSNVG